MTILRAALLAASAAVASAGAAQSDPVGRAAERGAEDYRFHCMVCHGQDGRGDGPFAVMLTATPTDLRKLAAENDGAFPFERVYRVIDGRVDVPGHGGPEMPVWGNEFNDLALRMDRETPMTLDRERIIAGRVLGLTMYLLSIQE
ncbi:MAG: c-type cytochrome [Pseudomonadota bacterium]